MDFTRVIRQVGDVWVDGDTQNVPIEYVNKWQRTEERKVYSIFKIAKNSWEQLKRSKIEIKKHVDQLVREYYKHHNLEQEQQSFTFYNFSKTLMVEVDSSKALEYDTNLVEQASIHFKAFLDDQMGKIDQGFRELIEGMILKVQKDKMPQGTVKKLERLGRKVSHPEMDKALDLIDQAQKRGDNRIYYRVRMKNPDTKNYDLIDLNFSAIEV